MRAIDFQSCPKTKANKCECSKIESITESEETIKAICQLEHSNDNVSGFVKFKQKFGEETIIKGIIKGLTPGLHGFHIHEFGDLSDGCASAGGHYNPEGVDHGGLEHGHVGDLGNIKADDQGIARFQFKAPRVQLHDVVGRAIVIHADTDDLGQGGDEESTKTGNAGDRVACGVIRLKSSIEEDYNRALSDKHFNRNELPQIRRSHIKDSDFNYKEGKISIDKIKPVQSQRVDGLSKKAEDVFLKNADRPFIVDRKGYLINGHHRFDAANVLGIKKVPAIMIDADIEDVIKTFAHTTSDAKTMAENYFKNLLETKMNKPQFDVEWDEAQRYPEFKKLGKDGWVELASKGKATTIVSAKDINNTDAADVDSFKTLDPQKQKRATAQLKSGKVEMPIVAVYSDGHKELIGGNTRLTAMMHDKGQATVWQFEVPDQMDENIVSEGVRENFAKLKQALSTESGESKQMMDIYRRAMKKQASPEEIKTANKQFKDMLKLVGLGSFIAGTSMIPASGAAIFPVEKFLNTKFGISILPNGFKDAFPPALPKSLHKVGDKVTLDGATYDVLKVDSNKGTVDVKDQSGKVIPDVKSTTFFVQVPEDVVSGNFGGQADVPQLPHQEVLMAISAWEYGDTPIELSNGYVINAYEEGASADDNAWIVLDPQGNEYDSGTGSIVDIMQEFTPKIIDENFADGKVKGKSRPGRVKKAGASCKGSVSSLRAKAKKYSGERGKMYHWCANMKGGKKKS